MSRYTLTVSFDDPADHGTTHSQLAASLAIDVIRQAGLTVEEAAVVDALAPVPDEDLSLVPCDLDPDDPLAAEHPIMGLYDAAMTRRFGVT